MLKFLGRRKRTRNLFLVIIIGLLAASLILAFTFSASLGGILRGTPGDNSVVAKVGGYEITVKEFRDALNAFGQQVAQGQGKSGAPNMATTFSLYGNQVLESLVRQKIIQYEADQENLGASDDQVQDRLKQLFPQWPGPDGYRMRLQQAGTTPERFEESLRAGIAQEHLTTFITAAVQIAPQDVEDDYRRNNTNYNVRWVEVAGDKFKDQVAVNDAALRAYFDQHGDDFRITSEQRRARYIYIDQKQAQETVQVSDDDLRQNFNPETSVKQVRVSEIVLAVPKPKTPPANANSNTVAPKTPAADDAKEAEDVVKRAKGDSKPAEDFAKLARELSIDAKSRAAGGDIGWVNKSDKRDTDDPLNRVFGMAKDEISQPIRKGDKFYILKVTDRKLPSFEESRDQLIKSTRAQKAYSRAVEIAGAAEEKFKASKDADAVAAEINKTYGNKVASVKETPFFAQGDSLPELGSASEFETEVFDLQNPGDVADHINATGGFAIPQYVERRDPHVPAFDEVKAKVEDRYRTEKAKDIAAERARQLAQSVQTPDALSAAAKGMGLKSEDRAGTTGNDSIGPLTSETTRSRIYKLKAGEVLHEPLKADTSDIYVVASLISRKDADMGEPFQKERKSIEQRLLDEKRNAVFSAYLAMLQLKFKTEGKIKVFQDVVDTAVATTPGGEPAQPALPSRSRPARRAPPKQ